MKSGISIISLRTVVNWPSWDLIFEWEDEILKRLNGKLFLVRYILIKMLKISPFLTSIVLPRSKCLYFDLYCRDFDEKRIPDLNKFNYYVWIVDCYTRKETEIAWMEKNYKNCSAVFISSREVFSYLQVHNCNLPIFHLALSLPDKYAISEHTKFKKEYDVVLLGRQNPVLGDFLDRYSKEHPHFSYLIRKRVDNNYICFDQHGNKVGDANTRDNYISLLRKSRVGLYSTPGTDNEKQDTNGYSQVTPRFLEYISAGVHIIARYIENEDTDYFELDKICPNIRTYDDFSKRMDWALCHDVDMKLYSNYLSNHYTSVRVRQLETVMRDN